LTPHPEEESTRSEEQDDRAAKFAENPPAIPRKAIVVAVAAFVVLGLGGVLADHFFGGPVQDASADTAGTNPPSLTTGTPKPTTTAASQLPSSLPALLGLTKLGASPASAFTLETPSGTAVTLASFRQKVVVLAFYDSRCDDICPVLSSELHQALADLGSDANQVVMLTVNTDPLATNPAAAAPAEAAGGLGSSEQWHFLTGTLTKLDAVWKAYGVSVEAQKQTDLVAHNNVLYFVDPDGRLRFRATPFANESPSGKFSLPASTQSRFASGIASAVRMLLG
jgi:cytochrome oxidase Cu insertion factor (SCO1/SenC/PrrC family)